MSTKERAQKADVVELDRRAVLAGAAVVAQVTPGDLDRPTPCAEWKLHELLAHMAAQHRGFAAAAAGHGSDPAAWSVRLVDDPVASYASATELVLAAFAQDGVLERAFSLPELSTTMTFPGEQAIGFHLVDYVVHGWDVGRSIGVGLDLAPATLEAATAVAMAVPDGPSRLAPGSVFAPAVAASTSEPALDQVVAYLGRSPRWPEA